VSGDTDWRGLGPTPLVETWYLPKEMRTRLVLRRGKLHKTIKASKHNEKEKKILKQLRRFIQTFKTVKKKKL